jgi:hypothetical protein
VLVFELAAMAFLLWLAAMAVSSCSVSADNLTRSADVYGELP